jgi:hypothetical protein
MWGNDAVWSCRWLPTFSEDGDDTFLRNVGNLLQDHTASQPWRHFHRLEILKPRKVSIFVALFPKSLRVADVEVAVGWFRARHVSRRSDSVQRTLYIRFIKPCRTFQYEINVDTISYSIRGLTYNTTNSMEQSHPWEADSRSVGQDILWNPNVHYHDDRSSPRRLSSPTWMSFTPPTVFHFNVNLQLRLGRFKSFSIRL